MGRKTRVLVVDDSAVVREVITSIISRDDGMEVVAAVADPFFAMQRMLMQWPDVIVLDVEMPRMDGITFLRQVMSQRPTPVVICSSLTSRGAETTLQALAAGALAVVPKPRIGARDYLLDAAEDLVETVRVAARANVSRLAARGMPGSRAAARGEQSAAPTVETSDRVIAIGTSTGGTQALEAVLSALPRTVPGILVVQHMPEKFTAAFAQRLDSLCEIRVREACTGDPVLTGEALIAPGGQHMQLRRNGARYHVEVDDGPPVNRHRPSVDVLFRSVARHAGRNALGIIMTGMGSDGARGLLEMREQGSRTVAQDEESCVVFGMPMEAIKCRAAEKTVSLHGIPAEITRFCAP